MSSVLKKIVDCACKCGGGDVLFPSSPRPPTSTSQLLQEFGSSYEPSLFNSLVAGFDKVASDVSFTGNHYTLDIKCTWKNKQAREILSLGKYSISGPVVSGPGKDPLSGGLECSVTCA